MKKEIYLLFVGLFLFSSMKCWAIVGEGISGTCKWTVDEKNVLVIEPINGEEGELGTERCPWSDYKNSLEKVVFKKKVFAPDCSNYFSDCKRLTSVDVKGFDTSRTTTMYNMFANCESLKSLDLSTFNTENVTNMASMFSGDKSLVSLNVSSFNTSKVTTMSEMFRWCYLLQYVDVSGFDTGNVTDFSYMFLDCWALDNLDVSKFNTTKAGNMAFMFSGCRSLSSLDLSHFDTSNIETDMMYMIYDCQSLNYLDLTNFVVNDGVSVWKQCYNCPLNTIVSNSIIPSKMKDEFFDEFAPSNMYKFIVPEGCEELYRNAPGWRKLFPTIITDENPLVDRRTINRYLAQYDREVSGKYATFCLPFNLNVAKWKEDFNVSNNVYVFDNNCSMDQSTKTLRLSVKQPGKIIKAGTPFVVELMDGQANISFRNNDEYYTYFSLANSITKVSLNVIDSETKQKSNELKVYVSGTWEKTTGLDKSHYRAFNNEGDFGPATWIKPYRAYVYVDGNQSMSKISNIVFDLVGENTTDIKDVTEVIENNDKCYNLFGQRVNVNARGMIIRGGKKYFHVK